MRFLFLILIGWRKLREIQIIYFLPGRKKVRFDFANELKIGDVRYKHLTKTTIKVQLF